MISTLLKKIALPFMVCTMQVSASLHPLNELKYFADGLNIEGGTILNKYLKDDQIWANLCVVLDTPFADGVEWQEITDQNQFPLKEASLLDYNEAQVNYMYATMLHYYIVHAHRIADKNRDQTVKVMMQVHRNTSGPKHVELLENLLDTCFPELEIVKSYEGFTSKYQRFSFYFPQLNVNLQGFYGARPENLGEQGLYANSDIVLSFSLIAGLNEKWKSGTFALPYNHVPFPLKECALKHHENYDVMNHLSQILPEIIRAQDERVMSIINNQFKSINFQKAGQKAKKLTLHDFKFAKLLQVDGLFNPSQLPDSFTTQ